MSISDFLINALCGTYAQLASRPTLQHEFVGRIIAVAIDGSSGWVRRVQLQDIIAETVEQARAQGLVITDVTDTVTDPVQDTPPLPLGEAVPAWTDYHEVFPEGFALPESSDVRLSLMECTITDDDYQDVWAVFSGSQSFRFTDKRHALGFADALAEERGDGRVTVGWILAPLPTYPQHFGSVPGSYVDELAGAVWSGDVI
jgi:hypothetical protein